MSEQEEACNPLYELTTNNEVNTATNTVTENDTDSLVDDDTASGDDVISDTNDGYTADTCIVPSSPKIREVIQPLLPKVDTPEHFVICVDIGPEMDVASFKSKAGELYTMMNMMKKSVSMFVKTKAILDKRNAFSLITLSDSVEWLCDWTTDAKEVLYVIDSLQCPTSEPDPATPPCSFPDIFNLIRIHPVELPARATAFLDYELHWTTDAKEVLYVIDSLQCPTSEPDPATPPCSFPGIFNLICEKTDLPTVEGDTTVLPPPYIVRLLMVYGRSRVPDITPSQSSVTLNECPYFYADCLFLHEHLTSPAQFELIQDTFDALTNSLDPKGLSYFFDVSRNPTKVHNSIAKMLSHPLQRPLQGKAYYHLRAWPEG